jgi:hypothetical protein
MIVETPDGLRWKFEGAAAPRQNEHNGLWYMYEGRRWVKAKNDWTKATASSGGYDTYKILEG